MPLLNREKTMTINWNNITVTDTITDIPDFDLEFDLHDGWDAPERPTSTQVLDPEPLTHEETEGEDDDIVLDDSGDFEYNGEDDWIEPTTDDLTAIETGQIAWVN